MNDNQPFSTPGSLFIHILRFGLPSAQAWVHGNTSLAPGLSGMVRFYATPYGGVLTEAEFFHLPDQNPSASTTYFALHIHENGDCSHDFSHTGDHYNPDNAEHPWHRGDLLPLVGNQGYAWGVFYDKRFDISDILGRSVVVHANPDDFTTQPSGNSGLKIGCGTIRRL